MAKTLSRLCSAKQNLPGSYVLICFFKVKGGIQHIGFFVLVAFSQHTATLQQILLLCGNTNWCICNVVGWGYTFLLLFYNYLNWVLFCKSQAFLVLILYLVWCVVILDLVPDNFRISHWGQYSICCQIQTAKRYICLNVHLGFSVVRKLQLRWTQMNKTIEHAFQSS